ncbi:hypothetical protein N566_23030 [Streptomycetaceae bacterium MP113-05]|nr:hypothetical protein N566_23030 [Streptomycetaceae bacterium MP113-05]
MVEASAHGVTPSVLILCLAGSRCFVSTHWMRDPRFTYGRLTSHLWSAELVTVVPSDIVTR